MSTDQPSTGAMRPTAHSVMSAIFVEIERLNNLPPAIEDRRDAKVIAREKEEKAALTKIAHLSLGLVAGFFDDMRALREAAEAIAQNTSTD